VPGVPNIFPPRKWQPSACRFAARNRVLSFTLEKLMSSSSLTFPSVGRKLLLVVGVTLGACCLAIFTFVGLMLGGITDDFIQFLFVCSIYAVVLMFARPLSGRVIGQRRESILLGTLVIWVFLMVSEAVFVHNQSTGSAASGNVSSTARYQAISWILSFVVLGLMTCSRPAYLRRLFTGPLKWASIFAVGAVLSCAVSPNKAYSAALAFKLCLIVLTMFAIGEALEDEAGVHKLFIALFWGTLIVVGFDVLNPLIGPEPAFADDGRFGNMIGLSGACGMLLLLSLLMLWIKKSPWFLFCGLFSVVVMMLAGTKGGIVASFVSLMMFFLMLKRPAQALAVTLVFTVIFLLCVAFTPLGASLEKYAESGNASTLTGRTGLWSSAWPVIKSHPILGRGYRASRFLSVEVPGAFAEAGNMHNSFLEVLYNTGLAGLIPTLAMNLIIANNLRIAITRPAGTTLRYYAASAFALFVHLFVWGLVAVTVGGAPDNRFMTFFALLLLSVYLRAQSDPVYRRTIYGQSIA
jgi:O-antigen ligase